MVVQYIQVEFNGVVVFVGKRVRIMHRQNECAQQ